MTDAGSSGLSGQRTDDDVDMHADIQKAHDQDANERAQAAAEYARSMNCQ